MFRTFGVAAFLALAVMVTGTASAETQWQEGVHYKKLETPVPTESEKGIEVAEVFWYGCPHCYHFKPLAEAWEKNAPDYVNFVRIPAALGKSWEPHARAFYALEAMGQRKKVHDALFEALAGEHKRLNDGKSLAAFLATKGIDPDEFLKNYNSFGVNAKLQQAQAKVRGARVTGTPTMLVNGKYTVTATMAGSFENMLKVVDFLVAKEHAQSQ
ncbi:DSBA oxidoreductase [Marinobacter santoriniensis NKSG1]|uniref:Thiol:disulfide interchange protein n=1 Tax=Marinobacter santoriniensis NKSG1 TaxID=1288826 RepID=M7D300_9GAMM|nr:thiol:disulfide interchange protein DsbA/DsbL [Marinobacter santoriniensis]EMP55133.1 DSBA oxidoreductase [Marinobacter santoriniensis NKSG1]